MYRGVEIPTTNAIEVSEKIKLLEEQNDLLKESKEQSQEIIKLYKEKINTLEDLLNGNADKSKTA